MTNKHKKEPVIRFDGFTDAWEQRKLGELMSFSNGINAPKENYGKGRHMISVLDILSPFPIKYNDIKSSVQVDKNIEDKNKVENGDLVFVRSSEIVEEVGWAKAYLDADYALYSGFTIRGKKEEKFDSYFFELALNYSNRKQVERKAGGSTRYNVSQSILNSIELLVPDNLEQTKIGNFFKQLNEAITLQKRELELLKKQKKSLLQKMFPKKGNRVPEMRFAEFTDDWEHRKLGEMFSERSERNAEGELISVTINSGVLKASDLDRKDNSSHDKSNYKQVKMGDIAYNSMRMWQGASGYSPYNGILSPAYTVIIPKEGIDSKFFAYNFKRYEMIQVFKRNSQGLTSDTWNLKFPTLKSITVTVPCGEEQKQISKFFQKLDETIMLKERELETLKNMKKSFLQKMFV